MANNRRRRRRRRRVNRRRFLPVVIAIAIVLAAIFILLKIYVFKTPETPVQTPPPKTPVREVTPGDSHPVQSDDWNYRSDSLEIHIEKSEKDGATWFTADVKVKDATQLVNAFGEGQFGLNYRDTTSRMAKDAGAVFAVSGDYYGFRTDGIIIRDGVLYRNKPVRTMLAIYRDGHMEILDETKVNAERLVEQGVLHTYSFGPQLVADGEIQTDAILKSDVKVLNPRTGVGVVDNNHFVFVVVDGRSEGTYSKGMELEDFARLMKDKGCRVAYNLDGGGTATMIFKGRLVNNPSGKGVERTISDALCVQDR